MKLSLRELLRWVWHGLLSWLAAITTGIDRPLCLKRSTKMVAKANDPEMAVGRNTQEEEAIMSQKEEPPGVVLREEGEVLDTFPKSESGDVNRTGQTMIEEDDDGQGTMMDATIANGVNAGVDGLSEDTLTASSATDSNQYDEVEANGKSTGVAEEDNSLSSQDNDEGNVTVQEDEYINNIFLDDWGAESQSDGNKQEAENAEESGELGSENQRHDVNEDDDEDDEEEEEEDEDSSEMEMSNDTEFIWLLELKSRETYQQVLSPQYHCLNFRTMAPLEQENVVTAIKQLHSVLPWLGFGLKQRKKNKWLCLLPEDCINFQMAHYEENLYDIVVNSRDQFNYLENMCLCSFTLMKAYPCTQCEAVVETQTHPSSPCVSTDASTRPLSEATVNTSNPNFTSSSKDSALMDKYSCEVNNESHSESTDTELHLVNSESDIEDPNIFLPKVSGGGTVNNLSSASIAQVISTDDDTKHKFNIPNSLSFAVEDSPTSNTSVEPTHVADTPKENSFTHNYRLVVGVPHPLADEKSIDLICDAFLKELNTVISKTSCSVISDPDKTILEETNAIAQENTESDRPSDFDSSKKDNEGHQGNNGTALASDNESSIAFVPSMINGQLDHEVAIRETDTDSEEALKTIACVKTVEADSNSKGQKSCQHDGTVLTSGDEASKDVDLSSTTKQLDHEVVQENDTWSEESQDISSDNTSEKYSCSKVNEGICQKCDGAALTSREKASNADGEVTHSETDSGSEEAQEIISSETESSRKGNSVVTSDDEANAANGDVALRETISGRQEAQEMMSSDTTSETDSSSKTNHVLASDDEVIKADGDVAHRKTGTVRKEAQEIIDKKKATVQQQFAVLENIFTNTKGENANEAKHTKRNNNDNAIDSNNPHIERKLDIASTKNFINKCKSERVSFISAFSVCVNAAISKTLVNCRFQEENVDLKIGHIVAHFNNLDDLSDDEWHDHDPADNEDDNEDDDGDSENIKYKICCKRPTVVLSLKPSEWHNRVWERAQLVDQKRRDMKLESRTSLTPIIIPLNTEVKSNGDERFPVIRQPQADLSISNISHLIPRVCYHLESMESMTLQKLSPLIIFLMTNVLSLYINEGRLCFSFHHQGYFVSLDIANQYADEIESTLNKILVS